MARWFETNRRASVGKWLLCYEPFRCYYRLLIPGLGEDFLMRV